MPSKKNLKKLSKKGIKRSNKTKKKRSLKSPKRKSSFRLNPHSMAVLKSLQPTKKEKTEYELENILDIYNVGDSKNISRLINNYNPPYSNIEESFKLASVKQSIKTGLENQEGYVSEQNILSILMNPNKYKHINRLDILIDRFLSKIILIGNNYDIKEVIEALMSKLKFCEYEDFQNILVQDYSQYENVPNLPEMLQQLNWIYTYFAINKILKEYTELNKHQIDEIVSELEYRDIHS